METLTSGVRWRWGLVCVGTVTMALGRSLGLSELSNWIIALFIVVGGVANLTLARSVRLEWHRWWLVYLSCLIDVCLVALIIVYLGPGGTIAGFFFVILPCAFRPSRPLSLFALFSASAAYLIAAALHGFLSENVPGGLFGLQSRDILDLILFVAVAAPLIATSTDLFRRIADIHAVIRQSTHGSLKLRAPATRSDRLGHLEQSLNTMLDQISSTMEVVLRGAEEIVALAALFAQSARVALESNRQVTSMASALARELEDLQDMAVAGQAEGTDAAQAARTLQSRAVGNAGNTRALEENVQVGRDRVARTSEAAMAVSADIRRAATLINELGDMSRQIGSSALSIAKVARHTHVLALNAAIEAARAEEHGKEFAVVADQVRTLAGEAGHSAREVGDLVNEVQAGIAAAANAMVAGEEKVNDVVLIAAEARSAMNDLRIGASNAVDLVAATEEISGSQVKRAQSLAGTMSQFSSTSARLSLEVGGATEALAAQVEAMNTLDQANRQLADLAERLRKNVAHFTLHAD